MRVLKSMNFSPRVPAHVSVRKMAWDLFPQYHKLYLELSWYRKGISQLNICWSLLPLPSFPPSEMTIFMKDAHCTEPNLWLIMFTFFGDTWISKCITDQEINYLQKWPNLHGRCAMCLNEWKINFSILVFEIWTIFWDMNDFVLKFR